MELRLNELRINRTWSWILIGAVVALVIAIWVPYRGTAHAATPAYTFSYGSNVASSTVDRDTKPSPFPDQPRHFPR
jgi:hypothetical protein